MNEISAAYKWVLLALCLWREARGCSHDQKRAVAHVITNRASGLNPKQYGGPSLVGVVTAPYQFTSISPPHSSVTSFAEWINATTWPQESDLNWAECCSIADSIGKGTDGPDPTNGANHYYTEPISAVPVWADPSKMTLQSGPFRFFKL